MGAGYTVYLQFNTSKTGIKRDLLVLLTALATAALTIQKPTLYN